MNPQIELPLRSSWWNGCSGKTSRGASPASPRRSASPPWFWARASECTARLTAQATARRTARLTACTAAATSECLYDRLSDPESLKEREAVHTSCRKVYQGKRIVGVLASTLVKAKGRSSPPSRLGRPSLVPHLSRRRRHRVTERGGMEPSVGHEMLIFPGSATALVPSRVVRRRDRRPSPALATPNGASEGGRSRLRAVSGEERLPGSRRRGRVLGGVTAGAAVLSWWVGNPR